MPLNFTTSGTAGVSHGIKVLVYGGSGFGKTRLITTAPAPFVLSAEAGMLSIRKWNLPAAEIYTIQDFEDVLNWIQTSAEARQFGTFCVDSISEIAEQCLNNAKRTVKDPRQAYGELIEKMESLIRRFRDIKGPNVYMAAKMEPMKDEMTGIIKYGPKMPGAKLGPSLPYFFDEVFRLGVNKDPQGVEYRFLQTQPDLQHEAKDRSGSLAAMEPPDLTHIFTKIQQGAL